MRYCCWQREEESTETQASPGVGTSGGVETVEGCSVDGIQPLFQDTVNSHQRRGQQQGRSLIRCPREGSRGWILRKSPVVWLFFDGIWKGSF